MDQSEVVKQRDEAIHLLRESREFIHTIFKQGLYPRGATHGKHPTGYLPHAARVRRFLESFDSDSEEVAKSA